MNVRFGKAGAKSINTSESTTLIILDFRHNGNNTSPRRTKILETYYKIGKHTIPVRSERILIVELD